MNLLKKLTQPSPGAEIGPRRASEQAFFRGAKDE